MLTVRALSPFSKTSPVVCACSTSPCLCISLTEASRMTSLTWSPMYVLKILYACKWYMPNVRCGVWFTHETTPPCCLVHCNRILQSKVSWQKWQRSGGVAAPSSRDSCNLLTTPSNYTSKSKLITPSPYIYLHPLTAREVSTIWPSQQDYLHLGDLYITRIQLSTTANSTPSYNWWHLTH